MRGGPRAGGGPGPLLSELRLSSSNYPRVDLCSKILSEPITSPFLGGIIRSGCKKPLSTQITMVSGIQCNQVTDMLFFWDGGGVCLVLRETGQIQFVVRQSEVGRRRVGPGLGELLGERALQNPGAEKTDRSA